MEVKRRVVAAGAGVGVVALLAVTALASRGPLSKGGGLASGGGALRPSASPWALALVAVAAVIALAGLVASLRWRVPRRRIPDPHRTQTAARVPWLVRFVVLLLPLALGAVLAVAAIEGSRTRTVMAHPPAGRAGVSLSGRAAPQTGTGSSFSVPGWVPFTVFALALASGGGYLLVARVPRRPHRADLRARAAPLIDDAVDVSLEDLRADPDPRRAVIAAYARMEAALAAADLPRKSAEAPREYMTRTLGLLELSDGPVRTLTSLFERAKFSLARFDWGMRDQAIGALLALREELG